MNTLYAHNRKIKKDNLDATIAIQVPDKAHLSTLFNSHSNKSMALIGFALKSPHDDFIKSAGRTIAEQRMVPVIINLTAIEQVKTKHVWYFRSEPIRFDGREYIVRFRLTTVLESARVRLISALIEQVGGR